jgi:hypothetical protein
MVVEEKTGDIAIVSDGSGGYLVVEIIDKASTYAEAKEIFDAECDEELEEDEEEEDDEEDDTDSD